MPGAPTPERDPGKRLAALERRLRQLEAQLAGRREAVLVPRPLVRLAVTFDDGAYPVASSSNVYPIVFIDGSFTPAAGTQSLARTLHHDERQAFALSLCPGYFQPGTLVVVLEQNRQFFILFRCRRSCADEGSGSSGSGSGCVGADSFDVCLDEIAGADLTTTQVLARGPDGCLEWIPLGECDEGSDSSGTDV